jgi:hypothetical protein
MARIVKPVMNKRGGGWGGDRWGGSRRWRSRRWRSWRRRSGGWDWCW